MTRLTAVEVRNKREPGRYGDGDGLYLEVLPTGQRYWVLRYQLHKRRRDMSLGPVTEKNGLATARQAVAVAKELIRQGIDPIDARRRPAGTLTFEAAARELIDSLAPSWRGRDTRKRWERCLLTYAAKLKSRRVDEITVPDVLAVLKPMWSKMPESAGKTRECIERVLDAQYAAGGIRPPWENPARWRGRLEFLLPKRPALTRGHHPAMPYADAPAFMAKIREQSSTGARALELAILTACREGVVIAARWEEFDLSGAAPVWAIPAEKMKVERPFIVPLSPAAVALLERVGVAGRCGWVFPGQRQKGRPAPHISDATMDAVLKRMKLPYTPHGFRSTFRDWAGDCTDHAREIAEAALAHVVGDDTERAYRRSDALAKRRRLMDDWAAYLSASAPAQ